MTVRRFITFPDLGAALLERAAGPGAGRQCGDYLTAIMAQRSRAWGKALADLLRMCTAAEIHGMLQALHGTEPAPEEIPLPRRLEHGSLAGPALHTLLLEYNAGNCELKDTLKHLSTLTTKETTK